MENIKKYGKHVCWIVMVLAAAYLLWSLYRFHILPLKYYIPILVVILLIVGAVIYCILGKKANKITKILGCVFSIVLCICILFMNVKVINKAQETVKAVSNGDIKTTEISVLVKKDSSYKDVKDLDGKQFGILKTIDRENTDFMLNRLGSQFSNEISKIEYKEFKDEMQGLLDGNTDAIIMNEGMRDAFNIIDGSFEKETRVIYTLDRKEVLKNLKANNITKDPFIVYISGIDTNGSISKTSRSDVNMLAAVNPQKKELLLVFIPRDYYVLQCPNGSCETGAMDKLTHAGLYGVETSQATLSKLFDIKINYNVRLNFDTLTTMVDALDGIDIYSDKELTAYTNKNCSYVKGNQHVDGACALAFARERYAYESGDRHRGENQQQVIEAMLKKFTKSNVIKNYESIMNAVQGMFQTNMTTDEITALIQMQIDDMATWKVTSISADGTGDMLPTYSFGSQPLYVMHPKENAIVNIKKILKNIL
mgnify:CR=1 FL=1